MAESSTESPTASRAVTDLRVALHKNYVKKSRPQKMAQVLRHCRAFHESRLSPVSRDTMKELFETPMTDILDNSEEGGHLLFTDEIPKNLEGVGGNLYNDEFMEAGLKERPKKPGGVLKEGAEAWRVKTAYFVDVRDLPMHKRLSFYPFDELRIADEVAKRLRALVLTALVHSAKWFEKGTKKTVGVLDPDFVRERDSKLICWVHKGLCKHRQFKPKKRPRQTDIETIIRNGVARIRSDVRLHQQELGLAVSKEGEDVEMDEQTSAASGSTHSGSSPPLPPSLPPPPPPDSPVMHPLMTD
uniref:Uncharacterized protein n=1 Tax=Chromera velia CCMP2878 TaxID=1169474 RepID=A0A0G4GQI6_9ALVE|eukprot:Cvel_5035.t1-p1 / transcript=Cvel_5035.t1 / gene=Cvel_5035 / organism=Chromera_velia_CCMP2878 / gene_product=hypothetical protein / transcript_product=hypothetical protein / location=Cvel_scaffold229:37618-39199(+) / protein_length=299 / sequence_SO=supercontig / SO=protein_coding / is_pseudo=false